MSGVFIVVPLNTRPLNVVSTDKRVCFAIDSVLCVVLERQKIVLILFMIEQMKFDIYIYIYIIGEWSKNLIP